MAEGNGIRIGVVVPSVNIVVEDWYPAVAPAGVSIHFARMLMAPGSSREGVIEMDRVDGEDRRVWAAAAGVLAEDPDG